MHQNFKQGAFYFFYHQLIQGVRLMAVQLFEIKRHGNFDCVAQRLFAALHSGYGGL
jgi:hypothetical protein